MLSLSSCLLLLFVLSTSGSYQTDPLALKLFANHLERRAACNDGSPSGFAFKPGTGNGTKKWIVFLQGGSVCFDYASCASRNPLFKSSNQWGQILAAGLYYRTGILDPDPSKNPFFWNWNKIAMGYCTSDSYAGNSSAGENPLGLHFHGYGVMKAILEDIQNKTIMGTNNTVANATDVLVVGHSAGGVGMLANIDRFATAFPHANLRAINDGGWMVKDYRELDPLEPSLFEVATASMNLLWKPPASLSPTCIGTYGLQLASLCVFQPTGYPFVGSTPIFTFHSQMDEWAARGIPRTLPLANASRVWQKAYRTLLLESFNVIDTYNKDDAVMSPNCFMHNVIQESLFFSVKVNGFSYHDAVVAWMTGNQSVPRRLIRSCEYECEPSCPNPSVQPCSPECGEAPRPPPSGYGKFFQVKSRLVLSNLDIGFYNTMSLSGKDTFRAAVAMDIATNLKINHTSVSITAVRSGSTSMDYTLDGVSNPQDTTNNIQTSFQTGFQLQNTQTALNVLAPSAPSTLQVDAKLSLVVLSSDVVSTTVPIAPDFAFTLNPSSRHSISELRATWNHTTAQMGGNELWISLPPGFQFNACPMNTTGPCNTTAVVVGALPSGTPTMTIEDRTIRLRYSANLTLNGDYQFTLTNVRVPNVCHTSTYTVSNPYGYLHDLFDAGAVFIPKVMLPHGAFSSTRTFQVSDPMGTVKGCTLCNACFLSKANEWTCDHNGLTFLRPSTTQPCSLTGV